MFTYCRIDGGLDVCPSNDISRPPFGAIAPPPGARRAARWAGFALALAGALPAQAPQDPSPFDVIGYIQTATIDDASNELSGGTITINNQVIVVPANTILQMPAAALTWQEVFALAPQPWGPTQSGLALHDSPRPPMQFEAHVIGNRVGDQYIAGLMFLSQHSLQSSQGFINHIDYDTGFFRVGGRRNDPNSGQRVKINDPIGRFGRAWSPDVRFTIDESYPTVRSETGYPMGIPRNRGLDPLCPESNRPISSSSPSGFLMTFQMPAAQMVVPGGPDPRVMAPFEVGDYVTYSGILLDDGEPYVAAYTVTANVGIFTYPGSDPAYIALDVMIVGVGGTTTAGLAEATDRTVFEGFCTDPSRFVEFFGLDVDACTGAEARRDWGACSVDPGAPAGAVRGRYRFKGRAGGGGGGSTTSRQPLAGTFLPATREMLAHIVNSQTVITANGLEAGIYQAPIFEFLFPENAGVGTPVVPNNFETMPFLARGSGPSESGPVVGQLSPWPGVVIPLAPTCGTSLTLVADAGPDLRVPSSSIVTLDGSNSHSPIPGQLVYNWTQISGPPVTLTNATSAVASFRAPLVQVGAAVMLGFRFAVSGPGQTPATDTVNITVDPIVSDVVSITLAEYRTSQRRLTVTASSTAGLSAQPAVLTMQAYDGVGAPIGPPQLMSNGGAGNIYTVTLVGYGLPTTVRVSSDHGGAAAAPITRVR